jgi:hypothetical protein
MFRTLRPGAGLITVAVFAVGVALWCVIGAWLGLQPHLPERVLRSLLGVLATGLAVLYLAQAA